MKNRTTLLPFGLLVLVAVVGCGRLSERVGNSLTQADDEDSPNFTLKGKEWRPFDLDNSDIKVELPGEPKDKSPTPGQMPPGSAEVFSSMSIHAYDEKDFGSSYTQLVPTGKRKFEIKELADTSMTALKR